MGCLLTAGMDANAMAGVSAARSLATGEARRYHEEYMARLTAYEDPASRQIEVPDFTVKPHLLYCGDISANPADPNNVALAQFYGKDLAVLIE